jgi:uncharacterized membrane protein
MTTIARFLKVFALGTWLGGMIFFDFFVAVALFTTMKNMDQAGTIVGLLLWKLHSLGIIAAIIFLIFAVMEFRSWRGLVKPASILVELMLLLTLVAQIWIGPAMDNLRLQMGSYANTPENNPLRVQFDHLHVISVRMESVVLLVGFVALILTVAAFKKPQSAMPLSSSSTAAPPAR